MTEATTLQPEAQHQRFTASTTAYVANLTEQEREAECFAVHFAPTERSMIYPMLIVVNYCAAPKAFAEKVARILNAHWEEEA